VAVFRPGLAVRRNPRVEETIKIETADGNSCLRWRIRVFGGEKAD
jgi:hypothetical protein